MTQSSTGTFRFSALITSIIQTWKENVLLHAMQYNSDLSFCAPVELCSFLTYELLYFMPYRPKILQEISSS